MSADELQRLCSAWQAELRMQDWRIGVKLVDELEDDKVGACEFTADSQLMCIRVLSESGFNNGKPSLSPYDPELTLVHELLHGKFWFARKGTNLEFALDSLAETLVNLRRGITNGEQSKAAAKP